MGEVLADIVEWMAALPPGWAYTAVLVVAYGENVIPPIPGDMIVVFGGYMVGIGRLDWIPVIALATAGGIAGFMSMYYVGDRLGRRVTEGRTMKWLPIKRMQRASRLLSTWGFKLVVANRFLSGLRSVIAISVGMAHMAPGKTTFYSSLSALVWTTLLTLLGYFLGENWEVVRGYLSTYGVVVTLLIIAVIGVQVLLGYRSRKLDPDPDESAAAAAPPAKEDHEDVQD